jgi:hypothetical protein
MSPWQQKGSIRWLLQCGQRGRVSSPAWRLLLPLPAQRSNSYIDLLVYFTYFMTLFQVQSPAQCSLLLCFTVRQYNTAVCSNVSLTQGWIISLTRSLRMISLQTWDIVLVRAPLWSKLSSLKVFRTLSAWVFVYSKTASGKFLIFLPLAGHFFSNSFLHTKTMGPRRWWVTFSYFSGTMESKCFCTRLWLGEILSLF